MSKILNKAEILAADDRKRELVEVPEWGGSVYVTQVTASERTRLERLMLDDKGRPLPTEEINRVITMGMCALCIVDETGGKLFTLDDINALGEKSANAVLRVYDVVDRLNGISPAAQAALKKS